VRVSGWIWAVWFVTSVAAFAVLEGIAITNHIPGDSLTATIRRNIPYAVFFVAFGAFVAWFAAHMKGAFGRDDDDMMVPPRG